MKNLKEQLEKYRDRVKKWQRAIIKIKKGSRRGQFDKEQNTVIKFVLPFLEILGWNRLYTEMEFEYPVTKTRRVDIALYTEDPKKAKAPKTLVEVKPISGSLTKGSQLLTYLKSTPCEYGVYTNGHELKLISKRSIRNGFAPRTLFHLKTVQDFVHYRDVLWSLSKSSVKGNKLDKLTELYRTDYWNWRGKKKKEKEFDKEYGGEKEYKLPLEYARLKLKQIK